MIRQLILAAQLHYRSRPNGLDALIHRLYFGAWRLHGRVQVENPPLLQRDLYRYIVVRMKAGPEGTATIFLELLPYR
jgi:hypothetical protein